MTMNRRRFLVVSGAAATLPLFARAQAPAATALLPTDPAADNDRPEYHFLAPHNWMNDPNGPIFWKGKYHLFYQLNPNAAVWGDMHWGHAISANMIDWKHEPIALAPTPGGADAEGCFTGSAVVYKGVPTIIYTGVQNAPPADVTIRDGNNKLRETQMLATAEDDLLLHWKKVETPVIATPPEGMQVTGFRDPTPWHESDGWYVGIGSGEAGKGGCVLLYRSQDLRSWTYLGKLAEGTPKSSTDTNPVGSGDMWECPDFFAVDGSHCLFYSTEGKVLWNTGDYDATTHRFTAQRSGILDHGAYYAPKTFLAPQNRRIVWGWITEKRPDEELKKAGWAGCTSLPRELHIAADGSLLINPAKEVEKLRGKVEPIPLISGAPHRRTVDSLRHELALTVRTKPKTVAVRIKTGIATRWELLVDYTTGQVHCGEIQFPIPPTHVGSPDVRVFFDGSVIEAFIGGREAITSRVYGLAPYAATFETEYEGPGHVQLLHWPLRAISKDRLTT
ncbi:MAG TPA: glycoside hydrolase family 32 protein [Terracidiphilus sp.]|nr:glycoside hydrolase family 32 protein [Terracidiphilus sp.]